MAKEVRREAEITRRTSSALRVLALAVGVVTPLIVVYPLLPTSTAGGAQRREESRCCGVTS